MEKKFSKFELARIKRTAQNLAQYLTKKDKLLSEIALLQAKLDSVNAMIEAIDTPTKAITGGYSTMDIIKKVVTLTDRVDNCGNIVTTTKYEFIYPETIIPPTEELPVTDVPEEAENIANEDNFMPEEIRE